ncbi:hypothetical protein [Bacillus sonorensis]|uniref:hypothetical protein n=1 Tax=Bacillus sonorensis TaxID=119858 RepID=UPI0018CE971B|nr:hypothetical protein [Bacillus sonorensis]MCY8273450.1 hypothetical protein [Bacillus sonorensis]
MMKKFCFFPFHSQISLLLDRFSWTVVGGRLLTTGNDRDIRLWISGAVRRGGLLYRQGVLKILYGV